MSDPSNLDLSGLADSKVAGQKLPLASELVGRDEAKDLESTLSGALDALGLEAAERDENPAAGLASALESTPDQLSSALDGVDIKTAGNKLPIRRLANGLSNLDFSGLADSKVAGQKLPLASGLGKRQEDGLLSGPLNLQLVGNLVDGLGDATGRATDSLVRRMRDESPVSALESTLDDGSKEVQDSIENDLSLRGENPASGLASALASAPQSGLEQVSGALDNVDIKTAGQKLPVRRDSSSESPLQQVLEKQGKDTIEGLHAVNVNGSPLSDVLMQRLVARLVPGVADAKATGLNDVKVDGQKLPLAGALSEKRLVPGVADAKASGLDDANVEGQKLPLAGALSEKRLVPGVADAKATGLDDAKVDGQKLPLSDVLSQKRLVPGVADAKTSGLDSAKVSGQKLPTDSLLKGTRGLPTDALSPSHAISGLDSVKVNGKHLSKASQKSIMESLQQDLQSRLVSSSGLDPSSSSFNPQDALSPVLTSGQDNGYGEGDSQQLASSEGKKMIRKRLLGGQHRHFELPPRQ